MTKNALPPAHFPRTDFEHDELNRLRAKVATDHPSRSHAFAVTRVEYDLDSLGQRTGSRVFNAAGMKLYEDLTPRDARGRINENTITGGAAIDYDYYANNLLKSVASDRTDGVNFVYGYDVLNRLETVMNGGGGRTTDRTDAS